MNQEVELWKQAHRAFAHFKSICHQINGTKRRKRNDMSFKLKFAPANNRGFQRADFKDRNGEECSMAASSIATEECVWLGQNEGTHHMGKCLARMHLDRKMAREIGLALLRFADTGEL
jgi:hypothetical protein